MSSTNTQIQYARRALRNAEAVADAVADGGSSQDVDYHIAVVLAFIGGARQILAQTETTSKSIYAHDDRDPSYAAAIGLRNVEFHSMVVTTALHMGLNERLGIGEHSVTALVTPVADGAPIRISSADTSAPGAVNPHHEQSVEFRIDVQSLPTNFMYTRFKPRKPMKLRSAALTLLETTNVLKVLHDACDYLDNTVVPDAIAQGIAIP